MLNRLKTQPGYSVLPLDGPQALAFGAFPGVRDPMDRMILSAAKASGCPLVSVDEKLSGHGVPIVWD